MNDASSVCVVHFSISTLVLGAGSATSSSGPAASPSLLQVRWIVIMDSTDKY
ncbi:hypothetical protein BJX61DRAFT_504749 [Aspergillus egyptiacus]|nr:hypothetical protein BJX61DRAFT_504749 [Aspergillus egyptiacus]